MKKFQKGGNQANSLEITTLSCKRRIIATGIAKHKKCLKPNCHK